MARLRFDGVEASLGASLTDVATSITFTAKLSGLAGDVPTIASPDYMAMVIGDEIVYLTAYTTGATTGTISRGEESTTAAAHTSGAVAHTVTAADFGSELAESTAFSSRYAPYSRIEQVVATAGQGTITFSSIPQNFDALEIQWTAVGASSFGGIAMRFNNDTTAVYDHALVIRYLTTGTSSTLSASEADTSAVVASIQELGGRGTVRIPGYAVSGITRESYFAENISLKSTSAFGEARFYMGLRRSTDAITRIDLIGVFGGGFAAGSTFTLVGVGGTHS